MPWLGRRINTRFQILCSQLSRAWSDYLFVDDHESARRVRFVGGEDEQKRIVAREDVLWSFIAPQLGQPICRSGVAIVDVELVILFFHFEAPKVKLHPLYNDAVSVIITHSADIVNNYDARIPSH